MFEPPWDGPADGDERVEDEIKHVMGVAGDAQYVTPAERTLGKRERYSRHGKELGCRAETLDLQEPIGH